MYQYTRFDALSSYSIGTMLLLDVRGQYIGHSDMDLVHCTLYIHECCHVAKLKSLYAIMLNGWAKAHGQKSPYHNTIPQTVISKPVQMARHLYTVLSTFVNVPKCINNVKNLMNIITRSSLNSIALVVHVPKPDKLAKNTLM